MENRGVIRPSLKMKFMPYLALRARLFSISNIELNEYIQSLFESNPFIEESNIVSADEFFLENLAYEDEDIYSFLCHQLNMIEFSEKEREIAEYIVSNLDEQGYLRISIKNIASKFKTPEREALNILRKVQLLDPPGIASRSLAECFVLQLERDEPLQPKIKRLMLSNFEDFVKCPPAKIAKKYSLSEKTILGLRERLGNLNPSPGFLFKEPKEIMKVPDLLVEKDETEFIVHLNSSFRRSFIISEKYEQLIRKIQDKLKKEELERLREHAIWVKNAVETRDKLLLEIGKKIVEINKPFFCFEKGYPEKLSLEEFANPPELSYSVVSRLIQNKYIGCPKGILPLHFFVKHKLAPYNEEGIKNKIKHIVDQENKKHPLTDEEIEEILSREGLKIKRRTVSKYRTFLNIPPASKRRVDY